MSYGAIRQPPGSRRTNRREPVEATVPYDLSCTQLGRELEATGLGSLNAQSPSERWDGD
jgi:hypothetical protein